MELTLKTKQQNKENNTYFSYRKNISLIILVIIYLIKEYRRKEWENC